MSTTKTIALLAAVAAFAGCGHTLSISQLPREAQDTIMNEVKDGQITDIDEETTKGLIYYEVEYKRAGEDFDMQVSEHGDIMEKDR